MNKREIWIVVSKQIDPNGFYVKVDGSEHYTAIWIASATTKESALSMVNKTIVELALGKTEIVETNLYDPDYLIDDPKLVEKIETIVERLRDYDDVNLAAWVTSNGGVW